MVLDFLSSGVDVTSILQSLASGPLEPVFNALLKEHAPAPQAPLSGGLHEQGKGESKSPPTGGGDEDEEDEDDNEDDDEAIEGTFQKLSRSLRRPKEPSSKTNGESKAGGAAAPAKKLSAGSGGADKGCRCIEAKGAKSDNDEDEDASTVDQPKDDEQDSDDYDSEDDEEVDLNDGDDYADDMAEFEAEPPLESPSANKGGRPPILA